MPSLNFHLEKKNDVSYTLVLLAIYTFFFDERQRKWTYHFNLPCLTWVICFWILFIRSKENAQHIKKLGNKIVKGNIPSLFQGCGITGNNSLKTSFFVCAKFSIISIQHFHNKIIFKICLKIHTDAYISPTRAILTVVNISDLEKKKMFIYSMSNIKSSIIN